MTFRRVAEVAATWITNLLTWGLADRVARDNEIEAENLKRIQRGEPRMTVPVSKDLADTMRVDPFWRKSEGAR